MLDFGVGIGKVREMDGRGKRWAMSVVLVSLARRELFGSLAIVHILYSIYEARPAGRTWRGMNRDCREVVVANKDNGAKTDFLIVGFEVKCLPIEVLYGVLCGEFTLPFRRIRQIKSLPVSKCAGMGWG